MPEHFIWQLTPVDLSSFLWKFSKHRGALIVRAKNEHEARKLASERFGVGPVVSGHHVEVGDPWVADSSVACVKLDGSAIWSTDGPAEVLSSEGEGS